MSIRTERIVQMRDDITLVVNISTMLVALELGDQLCLANNRQSSESFKIHERHSLILPYDLDV